MIVVDTNIIVYLYIETEYSSNAEALYESDPAWYVPLLWQSEFRNVLAQLMRHGRIDLHTAMHIYYAAAGAVRDREYQVDPAAVLDLANSSSCSAYDCEFVQLAEHLGTNLITMDRKLLTAFPGRTKKLTEAV